MSAEIDELKELVREQTKLIQDTNKVVHGMRRQARVRSLLSFMWWVAVLGASAAAYYYYIAPYADQIFDLYSKYGELLRNFRPN